MLGPPALTRNHRETEGGLPRRSKRRERIAKKQVETPLVVRATLPIHEAKREVPSQASPNITPRTSLRQLASAVSRVPAKVTDHKAIEVQRALRNLHLLLRSERLYEKDHPHRLDSLDTAYDSIRNATEILGGLEIRVERGGLVAPRIGDAHLQFTRWSSPRNSM